MTLGQEIPGYEGKYFITKSGVVHNAKGKVIRPWLHQGRRSQYMRVTLYGGKTRRRWNARVHRLVALTYLPNPENKPEVDHLNGNSFDNRVCNLQWVTTEENAENRAA